jgi:hypothetical protein
MMMNKLNKEKQLLLETNKFIQTTLTTRKNCGKYG